MNFTQLLDIIHSTYYPAFLLDDALSYTTRKKLRTFFFLLTLVLGLSSLLLFLGNFFSSMPLITFSTKVFGLFYFSLFFWIIFFIFETFYRSYYFKTAISDTAFIDFDLAYALYTVSPADITGTFFNTQVGQLVLLRCGVSFDAYTIFLNNRTSFFDGNGLAFGATPDRITLSLFLEALFDSDKTLAQFFFSHEIQKKELLAIGQWSDEARDARRKKMQWWSRENLIRIPGIGQDWSYGRAFTLEKYRKMLPYSSSVYEVHSSYGVNELTELETVLSRNRGGNALLVGNDQAGKLDIISQLDLLIRQGNVLSELKHKNIILLDNELFLSSHDSKTEFEKDCIRLLREAIHAGNIIVVIENMASLFTSAQSLGVDMTALLEPYLSSTQLQIIGLSDTERFHSILEKNTALMQNFETILIQEVDELNTIRVLENELIRFENAGFFFTYPALVAIAESAERYFPDGVMPDKAIDLLSEIVPKLESLGRHVIEKKDILSLIEAKTGIPLGEVKTEEKNKLEHLEEILHKRIVGQDEAIQSISNAVRRARSGINNPNRPLASFLFLGPTGVGKTETTKALADVFFGQEAHIMRLDMSEYSATDAVSKLIGSFETNHDGILSSLIREHQYGVLLLDEFEKTTAEVLNLFLQILDEGFFSDMSGKKVYARNLIIIATSNAGSDLIWQIIQSGKNLADSKNSIVDAIVTQGIFKPELLNRFDGVILFQPLNTADITKIAQLMLQKLHDRLSEKGLNLMIDQPLIDFVAHHGIDQKFGARPMNRVIQEKIEQIVANKIINGSAKPGSAIMLTEKDLAENHG